MIHEVAHCLCIDVVVAGDPAHVRAVNLLRLAVKANEACSVQLLYHFCDFVQKHHVPRRVHLQVRHTDRVSVRILHQSLVKVRFLEPLHTLRKRSDSSSGDLGVDAVVEAFVQVALDVLLVLHHFDVVIHLFKWGQYDGLSFVVELWSASSSKDLLHVKHANVSICAGGRVVDLGALDKNGVGG